MSQLGIILFPNYLGADVLLYWALYTVEQYPSPAGNALAMPFDAPHSQLSRPMPLGYYLCALALPFK